jgi:hypothetical protein
MPNAVKQGEFCELRGVSKGRGSQWKAAGLLVFDESGLVLVDESNALLDAQLDIRKRAARQVMPPGQHEAIVPTKPSGASGSDSNRTSTTKNQEERDTFAAFNKARAEKEQELAISARLDRQEREKLLIARESAERGVHDLVADAKSRITGLADRYTKPLAAETDEAKIYAQLKQIERDLQELLASAGPQLLEKLAR